MLMTDCGGDYDCMCKEWWGVEAVFWGGWWWMVFELVFEVYHMVKVTMSISPPYFTVAA